MQTRFLVLVTCTLMACTSNDKTEATTEKPATESAAPSMNTSGYTTEMPLNWSIDKPANAEKVLALYKDWDNNTLDGTKGIFADSVLVMMGDGSVMNNTRDSVMATIQAFRNNYTFIQSRIHNIIALKNESSGENWVTIWAREIHTEKGKTDSMELHESYRFNNDGKVNWMIQYIQPIIPPK